MIKANYWVSSICLFFAIFIASCSSEREPLGNGGLSQGTEQYHLSVEASYEGFRSLSFDVNSEATPTLNLTHMPSGEVPVNIFFRKSTGETHRQLVKFKVNDRRSFAVEEVKVTGVNLAQGEWYMTAVIGGELLGNNKLSFTSSLVKVIEGSVPHIDIPYTCPWMKIKVSDNKVRGNDGGRISLVFKPVGIVVKHQILNETTQEAEVYKLRMRSNSLATGITFDLAAQNQSLDGVSYPQWSFKSIDTEPGNLISYNLSNDDSPIKIGAKEKSGYYLSWAAVVRDPQYTPWLVTVLDANIYSAGYVQSHIPSFRSVKDLRLRNGGVYLLTNVLKRPKLPIEYMAEHNLAQDGRSLAIDNSNYTSGYFFAAEAEKANDSKDGFFSIWGPLGQYMMPSVKMWRGIFPDRQAVIGADRSPIEWDEEHDVRERDEEIEIYGTTTKTYKSYYYSPGNYVSYGLRFIGHGNLFYSVWRYEFTDNTYPSGTEAPGKILKIRVRYLGPEYNKQHPDRYHPNYLMSEEYWKIPDAEEIVRELPAAGYHEPAFGTVRFRVDYTRWIPATLIWIKEYPHGNYWAEEKSTLVTHSSINFSGADAARITTDLISSHKDCIRPFYRD